MVITDRKQDTFPKQLLLEQFRYRAIEISTNRSSYSKPIANEQIPNAVCKNNKIGRCLDWVGVFVSRISVRNGFFEMAFALKIAAIKKELRRK